MVPLGGNIVEEQTTEIVSVDGDEVINDWVLTRPMPPSAKLTPAIVKAVLGNIAAGNYISTACTAAGITQKTFHNWLERGRSAPDTIYSEFLLLAEKARAAAEAANVRIIKRAADTNWTAAAWLLERQYPERWGRHDRVSSTVDAVHTLKIEWGNVPIEGNDEQDDQDDYITAAT